MRINGKWVLIIKHMAGQSIKDRLLVVLQGNHHARTSIWSILWLKCTENGRWPPVISDSGLLVSTCEQTENIAITVGGIKMVNIFPSFTVPFAKKCVPIPFNKKGNGP